MGKVIGNCGKHPGQSMIDCPLCAIEKQNPQPVETDGKDKPDCAGHKKDLYGQTDMKVVAEAIGDLHYETLGTLFLHLETKILADYEKDNKAGRKELANQLWDASIDMGCIARYFLRAWENQQTIYEKQSLGDITKYKL